jgi:uncharacterized protein (TIGR02145 family)
MMYMRLILISWLICLMSLHTFVDLRAAVPNRVQHLKPTVTTNSVSGVSGSSVNTGGNVTNQGGSAVSERGVCWHTSSSPLITHNKKKEGAGTGYFSVTINNLKPNTTYYLRAYAINKSGISYGATRTFKTSKSESNENALIETIVATLITESSVTCSGKIELQQKDKLIEKGICWHTSPNPTISQNKKTSNSSSALFTVPISNLKPSTTYYYRAYVTTAAGTRYGNELSFTTKLSNETPEKGIPSINISFPTNITSNSALFSVAVSGPNIPTQSQRGICYSLNPNPTVQNNKVLGSHNSTAFQISVSQLTPNKRYYACAFLEFQGNYLYSNPVKFNTSEEESAQPVFNNEVQTPVVGTTQVSDVNATSLKANSEIINNGGSQILEKGFCFSTTQNPTINDSKVLAFDSGTDFESDISGLKSGTRYFIRAYAKNTKGIGYGNQISIHTKVVEESEPQIDVITNTPFSIESHSIQVTGKMINVPDNDFIKEMGFCYGTIASPTLANQKVISQHINYSPSYFGYHIRGLQPNTTYYVRAYGITVENDILYGNVIPFTTSMDPIQDRYQLNYNGYSYQIVKIGSQDWFAENLRTNLFANGDPIPELTDRLEWFNTKSGAWCHYDNNPQNNEPYGKLYNWYAVEDTRNVCPNGWKVPTDDDWKTLEEHLGMLNQDLNRNSSRGQLQNIGGKLKKVNGWRSPNFGAENSASFSAVPSGDRQNYGLFGLLTEATFYWSSTPNNNLSAWARWIFYNNGSIGRDPYPKTAGFAIRCIKK